MDRVTRERFLASLLLAGAFHLLLALLLTLVDWTSQEIPGRMKPVVLLELTPPPEPEPEVLPMEEEPPPLPVQESSEEGMQESANPAPIPEPGPAGAVPAETGPAPTGPAETGLTSPGSQSRPGETPPAEGSASPLDGPSLAAPAEPRRVIRAPEAAELPPLPEAERSSTGSRGSRIEYGEEAENVGTSGAAGELSGRAEGNGPISPGSGDGNASNGENASLLSGQELSRRLEGIGTGTGAPAGSGSGESGAAGDADSSGSGSERGGKSQTHEYTFESGIRRDLLYSPAITIPPNLVSDPDLPGVIRMEIAFSLAQDGTLLSPRIKVPSGSPELDNVIQKELRKWRFTPLQEGDTGRSDGTLRLEIRIR